MELGDIDYDLCTSSSKTTEALKHSTVSCCIMAHLEKVNKLATGTVPDEHVATVTATHYKLAASAHEVDVAYVAYALQVQLANASTLHQCKRLERSLHARHLANNTATTFATAAAATAAAVATVTAAATAAAHIQPEHTAIIDSDQSFAAAPVQCNPCDTSRLSRQQLS
eukprot:14705-Heterococcus_DN1.PRE.1